MMSSSFKAGPDCIAKVVAALLEGYIGSGESVVGFDGQSLG